MKVRFVLTGASEYSEDARVRVVVGNRANSVVLFHVILERGVVASPTNNVEWRVFASALVDLSDIFVVNLSCSQFTLNSTFLSSKNAAGALKS